MCFTTVFPSAFIHRPLDILGILYTLIDITLNRIIIPVAAVMTVAFMACHRPSGKSDDNAETEEIAALDTAHSLIDTAVPSKDSIPEINLDDAEYQEGVLPRIEEASPEYAARLAQEGGRGFIVVDKARMKVILYDRYGLQQRAYGMACAKKYGHKRKKGDSRTPEGYFNVQCVYDSTDWLFTDDDGKTSKVKGQFGPRFIRIAPQIGIHGTRAPWSIGHRASHGCIRITNEEIMELVDLVHAGMPVIVIPGKRDRKVNAEEGYHSVYFPTSPEYEMSEAERKMLDKCVEKAKEVVDTVPQVIADSVVSNIPDSVSNVPVNSDPVAPADSVNMEFF